MEAGSSPELRVGPVCEVKDGGSQVFIENFGHNERAVTSGMHSVSLTLVFLKVIIQLRDR